MKKMSCLAVLILFLFIPSMTVFAGNINAEEQRVVDAVNQNVTYGGIEYKATADGISRVVNYLSQDNVDLTAAQADSAINDYNSNIAVGIENGYLVPVNPPEQENPESGKTDPAPTDNPTADGTQNNPSASESQSTGESTNSAKSEEKQVIANKKENLTPEEAKAVKEKEEALIAKVLEEKNLPKEEAAPVIESTEEVKKELISEEAVKQDEAKEVVSDYSNADPYKKEINILNIAVGLVVIVFAAGIIIVWNHRRKSKMR